MGWKYHPYEEPTQYKYQWILSDGRMLSNFNMKENVWKRQAVSIADPILDAMTNKSELTSWFQINHTFPKYPNASHSGSNDVVVSSDSQCISIEPHVEQLMTIKNYWEIFLNWLDKELCPEKYESKELNNKNAISNYLTRVVCGDMKTKKCQHR